MDESINTEVVLTANNAQYDQAMMASAGQTSALGDGIDSLTKKISNLTKTAGKTLIGIAAADVALIGSATAAWASYEKQMSQLNAQAAVTTRSHQAEMRVMKEYTQSVKGLRSELGTNTRDAANLTQVIAKMSDPRQTRQISEMSKIFGKMSEATGESSTGLATSLLSLQKVMGTPASAGNTKKYADQMTYLAAQTNTSATALTEFANQLAPIGKTIDLTQTQIAGFATGFTRAGQDGVAAASAFNKIVSDIAYATQSGSPQIAQYASLIGMTTDNFKELSGSEKVLRIFEQLNRMGPRAVTELNRMGLDGTRTLRAITAVAGQAGGLRQAIGQAEIGANSGAVSEGSAKAMQGMTDELGRLREELKMTGEAFASMIGPVVTSFVGGMEKVAEVVRKVAEGPFGKLVQVVAGAVAPFAAAGGGLLLFAGTLMKVAAAFALVRNSASRGAIEGFQGGGRIAALRDPDGNPTGFFGPGQGRTLGPSGQRLSEGGTWGQRGLYNTGQALGSLAGFGWTAGRGSLEGIAGRPINNRNPLSLMAGGFGMGLSNLVTPQFDQMRYKDETQRRQWLRHHTPWMRSDLRRQLSTDAGAVGAAQAGLAGIEMEADRVKSDDSISNKEKAARLEAIAATKVEAQQRLLQAQTNERATMSVVAASAKQQASINSNATGFNRATRAIMEFSVAATGAVAGGMLAGGKALARSPLAAPMAGTAALMGAGALGMESNAVAFGATGLMFGAAGGAAGLALGAGFDVYAQHKSMQDRRKAFDDALKNGMPSEIYSAGQGDLQEVQRLRELGGGVKPDQLWSFLKMGAEGAATFDNPYSKRLDAAGRVERESNDVRAALTAVAHRLDPELGKNLASRTFDSEKDWAKLDEVVTRLAPAMEQMNVTVEDIVTASRGSEESFSKFINDLVRPTLAGGGAGRIRASGVAGSTLLDSEQAQKAIQFQEDASAFYSGIEDVFSKMNKRGMSLQEIVLSSERAQQAIENENSREYEISTGLTSKAQQELSYRMPLLSRTQGFAQQTGLLAAQASVTPKTNEQAAQQQEAVGQLFAGFSEQGAYFKQLLMQQEQFDLSRTRAFEDFGTTRDRMDQQYHLSRSRAQEDFHQQRQWQEEDYQKSRRRAESDFSRTQNRGADSFGRSMKRSYADFNQSRTRQEEDYQHQVQMMQEAAAQSLYNIYERVAVQRTNSSTYLLVNAQDQLERLQEQSANLDRLRSMGMSDDAIQQMGLTDTANAQQLDRLVAELGANPAMIKEFNKAIQDRIKAAAELVTDDSSKDWEEFQRQYELARKRAQQDFTKSVARSHEDFKIQMNQMEDDFRRSMNRQAADYETAQERQQKQFSKSMGRAAKDYAISVANMTADFGRSMDRAKEDMDLMAKSVSMSLKDVLVRSTKELGAESAKQAKEVLKTFNGIEGALGEEGIQIMTQMSRIFGFEYTAPKSKTTSAQSMEDNLRRHGLSASFADGGVLPGYTPGRDVYKFYDQNGGGLELGGGEAIMRPEWVRAIGGPKSVEWLNRQAKYGGFAEGGVFNPDARVYMDGEPITAITRAQVLLAEKLSRMNFSIMQGSWQNATSYSGTSHTGPGVIDTAPGNFDGQYWLRRVGFAAWGRNFPGAAHAGSGAHIHAISRVDPGARNHPQLSSFARGEDGLGGRDYGPNPGLLPGLMGMLPQFMGMSAGIGSPSDGGTFGQLSKLMQYNAVLKDEYPKLEKAAAKVRLNNGLFEKGWWSRKVNNQVKDLAKDQHWFGDGALFNGPQVIGVGERGPEAVIPLNERGADFMGDLMRKLSPGLEGNQRYVTGSTPMCAHHEYNYNIDRSTNFTGAITVQANNPQELITQLQARNRVMALAQASLGGSRI